MKLDILAFGAHPDDVELACGGTLHSHIQQGFKVGVIDLTRGELGSRGTVQTRNLETAASTKILGLSVRENLNMADGFFVNDKAHQLQVIQAIRKYQPEMVFINAPQDRHPDHGKGYSLLKDACFLSGLINIKTACDGVEQVLWRPKKVFAYIQDFYIAPDFIVDISDSYLAKMKSIKCFETQFFADNNTTEPITYISKSGFLESIEARCLDFGKRIGVQYGEGFLNCNNTLGLHNLFHQVLPSIS
jgi:N-acetylglucosamine malate deacetylase 1